MYETAAIFKGLERIEKAQPASAVTITPQMKVVLDYLAEYGAITEEELQELLNVKKTRAYRIARQMNEEDLIKIEGRDAGKRYKLRED